VRTGRCGVAPTEAKGYKLGRFDFDLLLLARAVARVEAGREDEYAPVKNAEGSEPPAPARRALDACAHSVIDGREEASRPNARDARAGGPVRRVGPGVPA
jgi:UDP-N-acetylglucosamine pyrophosphorylase